MPTSPATITTAVSSANRLPAVLAFAALLSGGLAPSAANAQLIGVSRQLGSTGNLDANFGSAGMLTTSRGGGDCSSALTTGMARSGFKFVVAGQHCNSSSFVVSRLANGAPDTSFNGGNPKIVTGINANAVAIDSSGRVLLAGSYGQQYALARLRTDGALDGTFGNGGRVYTDFVTMQEELALAIVIQSDGKIVLGGEGYFSGPGGSVLTSLFTLARYKTNGALDPDFNHDGKITADWPNAFSEGVLDLAIGPNGRVVAAGYAMLPADRADETTMAVARFTSDGAFDEGFSSNGKTFVDFTETDFELGAAVAVDSSNRVVVGSGVNNKFGLARLTSGGVLDNTFHGNGVLTTDFVTSAREDIDDIAIQSNGRIVAAGWAHLDGKFVFANARYLTNGDLDQEYHQDGKAFVDFTTRDELGAAVIIDSGGGILTAGTVYP